MGKTIKTSIDGVPVELDLVSIGPSTKDMIDSMQNNLYKEIEQESTNKGGVTMNAKNDKDINIKYVDKIEQIGNEIQNSTDEKPWWTSKIIITNAAFIISGLAAIFGLNIPISEEVIAVVGAVMGVINIYLRKVTTKPISKEIIPSYLNFRR